MSDELAQKIVSLEQVSEENRTLRASLERTRGQLEERDLLIRRFERSESNNANVLGRIQPVSSGSAARPRQRRRVPRIVWRNWCASTAISDHPCPGAPHAHWPCARLRTAYRLAVREPSPRADLEGRAGTHHRGSEQHQRRDGERTQGHPAPAQRRRYVTIGEIQFATYQIQAPEGAADQAPAGAQAAPAAVTILSDLRPGDSPKGEPPPELHPPFIGTPESGIFRALRARLAQR